MAGSVYGPDGLEKGTVTGGETCTMVYGPDGSPKTSSGSGGAPTNAQYIVGAANGVLTNELVAQDTATIEFTGAAGLASWDKRYRGCRVYNNTTQSIPNNTLTAVTYNSENDDVDSFHSVALNTSRITIPAGLGGRYQIVASVRWAANGTGRREARLYLNGSGSTLLQQMKLNPMVGTEFDMPPLVTEYTLAAGDYVEVYVLQNSGAALNLDGQTYAAFMVRLVGV